MVKFDVNLGLFAFFIAFIARFFTLKPPFYLIQDSFVLFLVVARLARLDAEALL